ncbi:hypothetical protein HMPREF1141_0866 [Clostridium sp. MSTE9]|nr:hypothetical protein HMPREF1141_0866 [Clostridium sp. MSTE9]
MLLEAFLLKKASVLLSRQKREKNRCFMEKCFSNDLILL